MSNKQNRFLVGVPLFLLIVLALPLFLLLAPVVFIACLAVRVNPFQAFHALWSVLAALKGTQFEVAGRDRSVLVQIS